MTERAARFKARLEGADDPTQQRRFINALSCDELLSPKLLKLYNKQTPRRLGGVGIAQLLIYLPEDSGWRKSANGAWLADGAILTFEWREGQGGSPHLGGALNELTAQLKAQLKADKRFGEADWGAWQLWPHSSIEPFWSELGQHLKITFESAYAILAASLYLASLGAKTSPDVFATAAYEGGAIKSISGLNAKIDAIARKRAQGEATTLFVPLENLAQARERAKAHEGLNVETFNEKAKDLYDALKPLLAALDAPPAAADSLQERIDYANRPYLDYPQHNNYYIDHILDEQAKQLRAEQAWDRPHTLITVLSKSPALARLIALQLMPKRLLVLPTAQTRDDEKAKKLLELQDIELQVALYDSDIPSELDALEDWIEALLAQLEPGFVVDLTAGTGLHSVIMRELARRGDGSCVYFSHEFDEGMRRVIYSVDPRRARLHWFEANGFTPHRSH